MSEWKTACLAIAEHGVSRAMGLALIECFMAQRHAPEMVPFWETVLLFIKLRAKLASPQE